MKRFKDFLIENKQDRWVYDGDFIVTSDMVIDGKMIKEKIPDEVTGDFDCGDLKLTTLEGCPTIVGGCFYCGKNKLTSLEGSPTTVSGDFYCYRNKLSSLEGCPNIVNGYFNCNYNKLTSLKGCPKIINGDFNCSNNNLTSLEGAPTTISGNIYCSGNLQDLKIERDFIKFGKCSSKENYWIDLLKHMIDEEIELDKITTWPDEFIETLDDHYKNLLKSYKRITKFML